MATSPGEKKRLQAFNLKLNLSWLSYQIVFNSNSYACGKQEYLEQILLEQNNLHVWMNTKSKFSYSSIKIVDQE